MTAKTKQARYDERMTRKGMRKLCTYVPVDEYDAVMLMCSKLRSDGDLTPHLMRSKKTGKWKSIEK